MQFSCLVLVICFLHELGIGNCQKPLENDGNRDVNLEEGNLKDDISETDSLENKPLVEGNAEVGNLEKENSEDDISETDSLENKPSVEGNVEVGNLEKKYLEDNKIVNIEGLESNEAAPQSKEGSNENVKLKAEIEAQYIAEKKRGSPADLFGTNQEYYYPTVYKDFGRRFVLQYPYKEIYSHILLRRFIDSTHDQLNLTQRNGLIHYFIKVDSFGKDLVLGSIPRFWRRRRIPSSMPTPVGVKKKPMKESVAEAALDKLVKDTKKKALRSAEAKLIPVKASPELVLSVAMQSVLDEANNPRPKDTSHKGILRTGEYWNGVWKEEVDPEKVLRTYKEKTSSKLKEKNLSQVPKLKTLRAKIMPGSKLYQLVTALKQYSPRLLYVINEQNKK